MSTITIELPSTMTLRGVNKAPESVDLTKWENPAAFVQYLLAYGWDVRMQRCSANADTTADKLKKEEAMFASMKAGELPSQGASASVYSLEDRIASKFLTLSGVKGKISDVAARWLEFAKPVILKSVDPDERKRLMSAPDELADLATEYLETVIEAAKQEPLWAKAEAEVKKPKVKEEAPQLQIVMKPKGK